MEGRSFLRALERGKNILYLGTWREGKNVLYLGKYFMKNLRDM
jgi:hypothetical protein